MGHFRLELKRLDIGDPVRAATLCGFRLVLRFARSFNAWAETVPAAVLTKSFAVVLVSSRPF